jgi:tetratricopeptide (TPR) repeat protein
MQFEDRDRVDKLFLSAADLAPEERASFLESACGEDQELRAEVESLLAGDERSVEQICAAVGSEAALLFDAQAVVGGRLGAYRVVKEIGRGGMGVVYLGARDDEQYQKRVAIKVVKRGMDTAEVLSRFGHERQILANLDHPYIARLLDAGTTPDGRPFFAMDYVEGLPVDVFCRQHGFDIKARCRLFLKICDAVSYAHRNLVVHRDLKPANIFILGDGTPKLLDFGVAKLLSAEAEADLTRTTIPRPFTPEYASPEQARGHAVTTATDIYSLGAVLYELLTGERAQPITSSSSVEIERAICDTDVPRPSLSAPGLDADLDSIVLMALRKEPERRYSSVDQFAEDLRRYMDGRPVQARQSSFSYRAVKFVRRRRYELAAAAVVIASLVAGVVISVAQWRQAEAARRTAVAERAVAYRERSRAEAESRQAEAARQAEALQRSIADQQRNQAVQQRARAEQRLTELFQLADRTLFDIHDVIAELPGAIEARRQIVKTTLDYLQSLEKDHLLDDRMRLALSTAYSRVGAIQGDPYRPSLGDFTAAAESYRRAKAVLQPLYLRKKQDPDLLYRWIEAEAGLDEAIARSGHRQEAIEALFKVLPISHRLAQMLPSEKWAVTQEPTIHQRLAILLRDDQKRALEHSNQQIAIQTDLVARFPKELDLKESLASALSTLAFAISAQGEMAKAAELYERSIRMREELLPARSDNVNLRRGLIVVYGNYAGLLGVAWFPNLGRFAEARAVCRKAVALARELNRVDSQDMTVRLDLGNALVRLGGVEPEPGGAAESLTTLQEAIETLHPLMKTNPKSIPIATPLSLAHEFAGHRLEDLGRTSEAAQEYRESLAEMEAARALSPGDNSGRPVILEVEEALARLSAASGERGAAIEFAARAVDHAKKWVSDAPKSDYTAGRLAQAYFVLASVRRTFGDVDQARESAEQAVSLWRPIKNQAVVTYHKMELAQAEALLREIAAR